MGLDSAGTGEFSSGFGFGVVCVCLGQKANTFFRALFCLVLLSRYKVGRYLRKADGSMVSVDPGTGHSVVYRRFSDFCALYQHLVEQQPSALVPMHPQKVPINAVYAIRELCEERVEWCHAFLGAILRRPRLARESEWVRHFLFDATEEWQSRLEFCAVQNKERLLAQCKSKVDKLRNSLAVLNWFPAGPNTIVDAQDDTASASASPVEAKPVADQIGDSMKYLKDWWGSRTGSKNDLSSSGGGGGSGGDLSSTTGQQTWDASGKARSLEEDFEPEWENLARAHTLLCGSAEPLQVYAPAPLGNQSTVFSWALWDNGTNLQNVHVRLDKEKGRSEASTLVAKGLVATLQRTQEQAGCLASCAEVFGSLDPEPDSVFGKFSYALRSALQAENHLLETLKSRHEKEAALELVLRSALVLQGACAAFTRCGQQKAALQLAKQQNEQKPSSSAGVASSQGKKPASSSSSEECWQNGDGAGKDEIDELREYEEKTKQLKVGFSTTCKEFETARQDMICDFSTAALRLARANIKRAEENQQTFKNLLKYLQQDPALAERAKANSRRLGLEKKKGGYVWDLNTPM